MRVLGFNPQNSLQSDKTVSLVIVNDGGTENDETLPLVLQRTSPFLRNIMLPHGAGDDHSR